MTWIKEKLGKRAQVISGYAFKSSDFLDYSKDNIPIIKIKNIKNGYVDINNDTQYVSRNKLNLDKKYIVENGDILISLTGSQITQPNSVVGRIAKCYFPNFQICLLNQRAGKFLINEDKMNRNFLFYLLTYDKYKQALALMGHGAASQANISPLQIENLEIFFPDDTKEQDKIAKILSNYDDLIENNNRRIKILEEMAQKIYKEWFVDFKFPGHETTTFKDSPLGKIPNDWEVKKVVELSTLSKGKSYKSSELVDKKDGLPFLNLKCVERDGGFKREGLKWFCGKYNDNHVVLPEDIIMAVTDMTQERKLVARPARIPHNWYKKYIMSMDLVKLVANNDINKTYLYSLLKYSNFSDEVKNHANGVNVLHLNPQNIEQFELVVASEPLRNNFGEIAKRIFNQIDVLYLKNENLKQTRDILLPRLISGEINVENMEVL